MHTNRPDVLCCDSCGAYFEADAADAISVWFLDGTSIDFHSDACERACYQRGGVLHGGRGTVLLLGRRTPAEHLAGTSNFGPEADVGDIFAWLR